jgi:hypothetical protein
MSVTPGRGVIGSVKTIASLASTRLESISTEKPCARRKCSVRPRGGSGKLFEGSASFATESRLGYGPSDNRILVGSAGRLDLVVQFTDPG